MFVASPALKKVIDLGGAAVGFVGGLLGGALSKIPLPDLGGARDKIKIIGSKLPEISLNAPTINLNFVKEKKNSIESSQKQMTESIKKAYEAFVKVKDYIKEKEGLTLILLKDKA